MTQPKRKPKDPTKHKVALDIDLYADLTGWGSAQSATPAHHRLAKNFGSPLLFGPPFSDDLLALMMHMFTADEADVAQHLPPLRPRNAKRIARRTSRSEQNVSAVLDHLSQHKKFIVGWGQPRKYTIFPLIPGTFELTMMRPELSQFTDWHRRFAELFNRVWGSGYVADYVPVTPAPVRYLPVSAVSDTLYMAWPSDRLEQILDRYDSFAIGHCQCRVAARLLGQGCDKPTENCVYMGQFADFVIGHGSMRRASRAEVLAAKKQAEQHGCITWMMNEYGDPRGNLSCSCCGCCCHCLEMINQFSAPGFISRPHFIPQKRAELCKSCEKCANHCPMGAWQKVGVRLFYQKVRCVGCGLCVTACPHGALELTPLPQAPQPPGSWPALIAKSAPDIVANSFTAWLKRKLRR